MEYKVKSSVQALDPETRHWLNAVVVENSGERLKVTWTGYAKSYDCWLDTNNVRMPILKRSLVSRNAINSKNFPLYKHPKYLQMGHIIFDRVRKTKFIVDVNDEFNAKVNRIDFCHIIVSRFFPMVILRKAYANCSLFCMFSFFLSCSNSISYRRPCIDCIT